jgi:hypothetical protein
VLSLKGVREGLRTGGRMQAKVVGERGAEKGEVVLVHELSTRQVDLLLAGGVINWLRQNRQNLH